MQQDEGMDMVMTDEMTGATPVQAETGSEAEIYARLFGLLLPKPPNGE